MSFFYSIILISFLATFFIEIFFLKRSLKKIPVRILVNGTRGKSTTVRLLYELFKLNNKTAFAKTTGDHPEIIYPDGSVREIKRFSPASIIENIRLLLLVARQKPDVFVMECMALKPEMQYILAHHIFKPHHTIITNILYDHGEVMGTSLVSVAHVIGQSLYPGTTALLKKNDLGLFQQAGIKMPRYDLFNNIESPVYWKNIPDSIIKDSWNIIQTVALLYNINEVYSMGAFKKIWGKVDSNICLSLNNQRIKIYNLFSVNDVQTADKFLSLMDDNSGKILILNCRKDRPLRSKSFVELISKKYSDVPVWLTGDGKYLARSLLLHSNYPDHQISFVSVESIADRLRSGFKDETSIICLGNHRKTVPLMEELQNLQNATLIGV